MPKMSKKIYFQNKMLHYWVLLQFYSKNKQHSSNNLVLVHNFDWKCVAETQNVAETQILRENVERCNFLPSDFQMMNGNFLFVSK